jgi:hypothetical protein
MLRAILIASAFACTLSGCGPMDNFYEGPDGDYGKSLFSDLQARNVKILQQRFDPKVLASGSPSHSTRWPPFSHPHHRVR